MRGDSGAFFCITLFGNGDGTFKAVVSNSTGGALEAADFNNDFVLELVGYPTAGAGASNFSMRSLTEF